MTIKTILKYFFQKFDGIEGIRIQYKGRLRNRPRYSRSLLTFGKIPSQTINHPLAYHENKVVTSVGVISVKVWIFGKVKNLIMLRPKQTKYRKFRKNSYQRCTRKRTQA